VIKVIPAGGGAGSGNITVDGVAPNEQGNIELNALKSITATTPTTLDGSLVAANGMIGVDLSPKMSLTTQTIVLYADNWTEDENTGLQVQDITVQQLTPESVCTIRFAGNDFNTLTAYREAAFVADTQAAPIVSVYIDADSNGVVPTVDVPIEILIYGGSEDISLPPKGTPLAEWSWKQLSALGQSGVDVSTYFALGDQKTLSSGYSVEIIDFYHDHIDANHNAPFTFSLVSPINLVIPINPSGWEYPNYGWSLCQARSVLQTQYINYLPEVVPYIRTIRKVSNDGGGLIVNTPETLFLFSVIEYTGSTGNFSIAGEGTHYPWFTVAHQAKVPNNAYIIWSRSCVSNTLNWCGFNVDSATSVTSVSRAQTTSGWPVFGFCI